MRHAICLAVRVGFCCLAFSVAFPGESLGQGGGGGGGAAPKGDITAVITGPNSGLSGGAISGDASLSLLTTCTLDQVLKRTATGWGCAADNVGSGGGGGTVTQLDGGIGIALTPGTITTIGSIGIDPTVVPRLGVSNTFQASQTIQGSLTVNGNITIPGTSSVNSGVLNLGGDSFLHIYGTNNGVALVGNTFVGQTAGNFFNGDPGATVLGNTGIGTAALGSLTTGTGNTGVGYKALVSTTTGFQNVALGIETLFSNQTGVNNTALGTDALKLNVDGSNNIAIGNGAGNVLGATSNDGNIYIGNGIGEVEDNTIRIGTDNQTRTFIAGINGVAVTGGAQVLIDSNGQLGTSPSSRRFKYDIENMDKVTEKLLQLRPVTFRYNQAQNDGTHPLQYGLIAEEVAEIYPELVQRSPEGEANTVLYHTLPSMLLNEFQKQHRTIESLREQLAQLQSELAALKNQRGATEIPAVAGQR